MLYLKKCGAAFLEAARRFGRKNGFVLSSHVAMSMMLALFPFVLFTVALAGAVAGMVSQGAELDDMIELVFGSWPEAVSAPIVSELYSVLEASNSRLMTLGGILALYFASNGVDAIRVAMTQAYRDEDPRPFWKSRALCMLFVILGGAGVMVAAVVEILLPLYFHVVAEYFPQIPLGQKVESHLSRLLVALMPALAVLACHVWLPGHRHRLSEILPGVLLTLLLWWGAGWGFAIYVGGFASYSATYAGLAGAMAALIFLYFNAAILIFGAEFNGALIKASGNHSA